MLLVLLDRRAGDTNGLDVVCVCVCRGVVYVVYMCVGRDWVRAWRPFFFLQTLTVDVVPIVDLPSATLLGGGESVFCDWLVCVEYVWGGGERLGNI